MMIYLLPNVRCMNLPILDFVIETLLFGDFALFGFVIKLV